MNRGAIIDELLRISNLLLGRRQRIEQEFPELLQTEIEIRTSVTRLLGAIERGEGLVNG